VLFVFPLERAARRTREQRGEEQNTNALGDSFATWVREVERGKREEVRGKR
jgi:hypothetical protein